MLCAPVFADDPVPEPIRKLKKLYPKTVLVKNSEAGCVVVRPDGPEFDGRANCFVELVRTHTGASLEVMNASDLVDEDWNVKFDSLGSKNIVALGNVNNNRLLSVLRSTVRRLGFDLYW